MRHERLQPPTATAGSWIARVLAGIGAAAALVASFFLGALVFITALGLFVLIAIGVAIRIWWLRRQFREQMQAWERAQQGVEGEVIEAEYTVVERRERTPGERR